MSATINNNFFANYFSKNNINKCIEYESTLKPSDTKISKKDKWGCSSN